MGSPPSAEATIVATRERTGWALPLSSGWFRFERRITNVRVSGSSHIDVPVQPVCPNEPGGKRSPREVENEVETSQPRARTSRSPYTRGLVSSAIVAGESGPGASPRRNAA